MHAEDSRQLLEQKDWKFTGLWTFGDMGGIPIPLRVFAYHENKFPYFIICKDLTYHVRRTGMPSQKIKVYYICIVLSICLTTSRCSFLHLVSFLNHCNNGYPIIQVQRISRALMRVICFSSRTNCDLLKENPIFLWTSNHLSPFVLL